MEASTSGGTTAASAPEASQDKAKRFVHSGDCKGLTKSLVDDQLTEAAQYPNLLLEAARLYGGRPEQRAEIFEVILTDLDRRLGPRPADDDSDLLLTLIHQSQPKEGRPGVKDQEQENNDISVLDAFEGCLQRDLDSRLNGASPELAKSMWDSWVRREKDKELVAQGAIYYCARYGNSHLLEKALDVLVSQKLEDDEMRRIFNKGRDGSTPLEQAVAAGHEDCVIVLGKFSRKRTGSRRHLFLDWGVAEGKMPILHRAIRCWNFAMVEGVGGHDRAPDYLKILAKVIDICPKTLCRLWKTSGTDPQTPLAYARDFARKFQKRVVPGTGEVTTLPPVPARPLTQNDEDEETPETRTGRHWEGFNCVKRKIYELFTNDSVSARRALYSPHETVKEFALNLSDFNQTHAEAADFPTFVHNLETLTSKEESDRVRKTGKKKLIEFEDTLMYLVLPHLSRLKSIEGPIIVERFLDWLWDRGVRTLNELIIPDSHEEPLTTAFVRDRIINRFTVTMLDWQVLDLSLDEMMEFTVASTTKQKSVTPKTPRLGACDLKSLTLYSSGNWGVVYHWISPDGLKKMEKLQYVDIVVVQPKPRASEDYGAQLAAHMKRWEIRKEQIKTQLGKPASNPKEFECDVDLDWEWSDFALRSEAPSMLPKLKVIGDFKRAHDFIQSLLAGRTGYDREARKLRENPIKIAVIDNGTDKFGSTLMSKIAEGASFVGTSRKRTRILPWYTATDAHGTQMADLISQVNRWCRLYPVRVGMVRDDILPKPALDAIKWAIKQDVDIISISWTLAKHNSDLNKLLQVASKKALVFCSTADRGNLYPNTWPPEIIKVSASNEYGMARVGAEGFGRPEGPDILIDGDKIGAHGPSFMKSSRVSHISGSSVATALASGIASLVMYLAQLSDESTMTRIPQLRRKEVMLRYFKEMMPNKENCVVAPGELFNKSFAYVTGQRLPPNLIQDFKYKREDHDDDWITAEDLNIDSD